MQPVKPSVVVVCVAAGTLLAALFFWVPGGAAYDAPYPRRAVSVVTVRKRGSVNRELPASVFNDKIRRFKFRLEYTDVVTMEQAKIFAERYSKGGNPQIIGAYPDSDANLLVVVGPPEAEEAIRETLATLTVLLHDIPRNGNLKIQKRELQSQGRQIIREIAHIEVAKVEIAVAKDENRNRKIKQLDERMQSLQAELDVVERQIQILNTHLNRLNKQPFSEVADAITR